MPCRDSSRLWSLDWLDRNFISKAREACHAKNGLLDRWQGPVQEVLEVGKQEDQMGKPLLWRHVNLIGVSSDSCILISVISDSI